MGLFFSTRVYVGISLSEIHAAGASKADAEKAGLRDIFGVSKTEMGITVKCLNEGDWIGMTKLEISKFIRECASKLRSIGVKKKPRFCVVFYSS